MHFLLGINNSYSGGMNLNEDIIQVISKNEFLDSKIFTHKLEEWVLKYFEKKQERYDFEIVEEDNLLTVKSNYLAQELNNLIETKDFLGRDYLVVNEQIFQPVSFKKYWSFEEIGNIERLEFLNGVFLRNFKNDKLSFYNDYDKAILTHRILSKFATDEDHLLMESYFNTPNFIHIKVEGKGREDIFSNLKNNYAYR